MTLLEIPEGPIGDALDVILTEILTQESLAPLREFEHLQIDPMNLKAQLVEMSDAIDFRSVISEADYKEKLIETLAMFARALATLNQ